MSLQEYEGTLFICQKQLEWSRSILAFILFYSIWHTDSSLNQLALQLPSAQAEQGKIFINTFEINFLFLKNVLSFTNLSILN